MTRIAELIEAGPTYSFEFFPPKNDRASSATREIYAALGLGPGTTPLG